MSMIQQWQEDLSKLPGINIAAWRPFLYKSVVTQSLTMAELPKALEQLGDVSGWITETSRVVCLQNQPVSLQNLPLEGEFFRDTQHWLLTRLPGNCWQLSSHQLQACEAAQANCLGQSVTHLHSHQKNARLKYWKLWFNEDNGPSARMALLAAIETNHKEVAE